MKYLFILFFYLPLQLKAQGIVSGKVTHSVNANAEGKADAGSKIFVFKYEGDAVAVYQTINSFLKAKKLRAINSNVPRLITIYKDSAAVIKNQRKYEEKYKYFQDAMAKIKGDEAERIAELQTLNAETNIKYDKLDEQAAKALSQAKLKALDVRTFTEEGGSFSLKVAAGPQVILIVSNNKVGLSTTELSGKIYIQQIDVKDGETLQVVQKFYPD